MTDDRDDDEIAEELLAEPPDRDSMRWLVHEPAVRNTLVTALAALAMVLVIMFASTGPIGSIPIVLLGTAGLVFRWPGTPLFVLLFLLWFLVFPAGIPPAYENFSEIEDGRFRPIDVILVFSIVVYVASHYRLYGYSAQAMPFENNLRRKGEKPFRRPPTLWRPGEIIAVLGVAFGVVLGGQFIWLLATTLEPDPGAWFPIKAAETRTYGRRNESNSALSPGFSRFVMLTGMIFFSVLFARLIFGYWRLRLMSPSEARMMIQDAGWDETRRENVRVESWRDWRKKRLQKRARKPAK